MDIAGTASDSITVQIPRMAIAARLSRVPDIHGRILDDPMGYLLADHFHALVRQLPHVEQSDGPTLANATLALIASCFNSRPAVVASCAGSQNVGLRQRVRDHIDRRLTLRDLSPARICRDLALSRPALYRAFGSGQGIAAYIRARRLEAVHKLLTSTEERRAISALAYQFGFNSEAHFSKVFRKRYGYSPRDLRLQKAVIFRRLAAAVETDPVVDTFLSWVKEIGQ
jgi:AraC-like DNA-binding protein